MREAIAYGQQQTVLDHSGTYLSVDVWIPTGAYTDDLRVSFRGLRMASPTSVPVYENGRCIGQIVTYVLGWNWDPEGACVVDVVAGWGTRRVLHNLWIR